MDSAPHAVVRTFEKLILFPVALCALFAGIVYLFKRSWVFGIFLVLAWLLLSIIGQSLPHRRRQSTQQLYSEPVEQRFGEITDEESTGLAKALMKAAFVVSLITGGTASSLRFGLVLDCSFHDSGMDAFSDCLNPVLPRIRGKKVKTYL